MDGEPSSSSRGRGRGRGRGQGRGGGRGRGRGRSGFQVSKVMQVNTPWTLKEKKLLLDGLKRYSYEDVDSLCRMVPTRSKKEIQDYLKILKGSNNAKLRRDLREERLPVTKTPVESWMDLCAELAYYEQEDLSRLLAQVFSIISDFSDFPESTVPHLQPNYRRLYRYIAAVMADEPELPALTSLESAVMVDLLHSVGDVLRASDTKLQRKVMCWKYKMLNHKYAFDNLKKNLDLIRKALVNDFSDLQPEKIVGGLQASLGKSSAASLDVGDQSVAADPTANQSMAQPAVDNQPGTSRSSSNDSAAVIAPTGAGTGNDGRLLEASSAEGSSQGHRLLPESSSVREPSVTHQNGKTRSVPVPMEEESQMSCSEVCDTESRGWDKEEDTSVLKRPGRKRIHQWRVPLKKPRLFSMNPFCIPVRLLHLKQHVDNLDPNADIPSSRHQRLLQKSSRVTADAQLLLTDDARSSVRDSCSETEVTVSTAGTMQVQWNPQHFTAYLPSRATPAQGERRAAGIIHQWAPADNVPRGVVDHGNHHAVLSSVQADASRKRQAIPLNVPAMKPGVQYRLLKMSDGRRALVPVHLVSPAGLAVSPLCAPVLGRAVSVGTSDATVSTPTSASTRGSSNQAMHNSHKRVMKKTCSKVDCPPVVVHRVFEALTEPKSEPSAAAYHVMSRFGSSVKTYSKQKFPITKGSNPSEADGSEGSNDNSHSLPSHVSSKTLELAGSSASVPGRQDAQNCIPAARVLSHPTVVVASPGPSKSAEVGSTLATSSAQQQQAAGHLSFAAAASTSMPTGTAVVRPANNSKAVSNSFLARGIVPCSGQAMMFSSGAMQSGAKLQPTQKTSQRLRIVSAGRVQEGRPRGWASKKARRGRGLAAEMDSGIEVIVTPDEALQRILNIEGRASKRNNRNMQNSGQQVGTFMEDKEGNVYHTMSI